MSLLVLTHWTSAGLPLRSHFPQHLINMQNFPSCPHLHIFKARPVSPKGPIAVFSPQKNHFLKMKHSTFLESRKSGCSFYIQWPFHFSARSVSTPASHLDCEFLGGETCLIHPLSPASCVQGIHSILSTGTPT